MIGLARLDLGQRVFVVRDTDGGAIGEWGTVARLRRGDDAAWIRLDRRHDRCPFPAEDATRSTMVCAWPGSCVSIEPEPRPATTCRPCDECRGASHHWLTSIPELEPDGGGEPFIPCKHCDARAGICAECGEGAVWPPTTNNSLCNLCSARGGI